MTAINFNLLPSFSKLAFADNADSKEALDYVLQLRKKDDPDNALLGVLKQMGYSTIGDLRRLTDHDWSTIEIPAICRIYLKNLVRQAARVGSSQRLSLSVSTTSSTHTSSIGTSDPFWAQLEIDFNHGQPFQMSQYLPKLKQLEELKFSRGEAMEALLVTGNPDAACEYLFNPSVQEKQAQRAATIAKLSSPLSPRSSSVGLQEQLTSMQRQWEREKAVRQKAEEEVKSLRGHVPRDIYKGYIRGLMATEMISVTEMTALQKMREELNFGEKEHNEVLHELGMTPEQFEDLKTSEIRREKECVVCLDKPKSFVLFDCMHLCLCEDCVEPYNEKRNKKCPICTKKVTKAMKIYL